METYQHLNMHPRLKAEDDDRRDIQDLMRDFAKEKLEAFAQDMLNTGLVVDEDRFQYWVDKHLAVIKED